MARFSRSFVCRLPLPATLALAFACSSSPAAVDRVEQPIVGGSDAGTCAWPAVVLVGGDCSGTLVHPQVVVTAAHCVDGNLAPVPKSVSFGEKALNSPARTVKVSRCAPSPKYKGGDTDDIGYCLLEQAVTDVPFAPVMAACEASALKKGVDIVEVGFGQSQVQTSPNDGFGTKRLIAAKIDSVPSNGQINVTTGTQSGEYYGDSGGPIFFQMPDKTWRFIGDDCCAPDIVEGSNAARISTYISAPLNVAWLESSSGVDLTVCHDGNNWSPTTLCSMLPTTPDKASGGWAANCSSQTPVAPQSTCSSTGSTGGSGGGGGAAGAGGKGGSASGGTGGAGGNPGSGGAAGSSAGSSGSGATSGLGGAGVAGGGASGAAGAATASGGAGTTGTGGATSGGTSLGGASSGGSGGAGSGAAGGSALGGSNSGGTPSAGGSSSGGATSGGASTGGAAGSPGQGGAHNVAGAGASGAPDPGSGCSCNMAARGTPLPWHVALAGLAWAFRRRKRGARGL